ncbi:MAG: ParA family protein [SAR202 cluster bacterium]|nr:ParA family protein [SAR202 cluster bacterium]
MITIATLNFKGGVGKTTVTWLLARYLAERKGKNVLVMDADPQMSLTTAVQLLDSGYWDERFRTWRDAARKKKKTLRAALDAYSQKRDVELDHEFFYVQRKGLELLPSDDELYWFELDSPKTSDLQDFVPSLLKAREELVPASTIDYVLVDCPPAFNSLSYSAVSSAHIVLVPINPDIFASFGVRIMLNGLRTRLKRMPYFVVFMNRAKQRRDPKTGEDRLTKESQGFLSDVSLVSSDFRKMKVPVRVLSDIWIPERAGIKRALAGQRLPPDFETYFASVWDNVEKIISS